MSVQAVNEAKYRELIESGATVLLDFYADWCGPCRMLSPVIEQIAHEHPEIVVGKVNVDEENALAMRFGITSIPFVALIKNGEVVARSLGYRQKDDLLSALGL
ncbi:MAG: thioredoxin [Clostridia bacterium]|nr:thioredoxin [Clostridia bacterium]MBQ8716823.1 thioredoxin [Clostridia bacterium]